MIHSDLARKIILTENKSLCNIFRSKGKIYTFLNPVSFLEAVKNKEVYDSFDGIFADGSLMVATIKLLYGKKVTRRSFDMTSIAPELFSFAAKEGKEVYIVASKQEQVELAVTYLKERNPGLSISGYRNGYFSSVEEQAEEALRICRANPYFLIVGMGAIAQEHFLLRVKEAGFKGIGFTCGGFIHQTAKKEIDYYPKWIDKMNLRFIYRMYKEPHTRVRYLQAAFLFPFTIAVERLRNVIGGGNLTLSESGLYNYYSIAIPLYSDRERRKAA